MDYFFIGDEELVTAFRFIGVDGQSVRDANEAAGVFKMITEDAVESDTARCRVLILTEETAEWLGDYVIDWQISGRYPLIVEIPGISGRHLDRKTLVDLIREAIGLHV